MTAAVAILDFAEEEKYKATVLVDGLRDSECNAFAVGLREQGVRTDKVKGVDDQSDILIRLADAICGFLRDAMENRPEITALMKKAIREGYLVQVGK